VRVKCRIRSKGDLTSVGLAFHKLSYGVAHKAEERGYIYWIFEIYGTLLTGAGFTSLGILWNYGSFHDAFHWPLVWRTTANLPQSDVPACLLSGLPVGIAGERC
jgi:hypothetical protein